MVKLASARESRLYGPRLSRNRSEYVNAGLHVIASILLISGFAGQLSVADMKSGLVLLLIGLAIITVVNIHDLLAHMAGIDFRLSLLGLDKQLALVEFAVPLLHVFGSVLFFLGILFLFLQKEKGNNFMLLEHAGDLLLGGPVLWVIGSIHNTCQVYERADSHVQFLQKSVQIPFLIGSLLFLIGAAFNMHSHNSWMHHGLILPEKRWIWFSLSGSFLLLVGSLMNLVKVFKMQQMDSMRLEKLRGGAQERLIREREGELPLILEGQRRKRNPESPQSLTSYKDALIGQS